MQQRWTHFLRYVGLPFASGPFSYYYDHDELFYKGCLVCFFKSKRLFILLAHFCMHACIHSSFSAFKSLVRTRFPSTWTRRAS